VAPVVSIGSGLIAGHGPALATPESTPPTSGGPARVCRGSDAPDSDARIVEDQPGPVVDQ
jgi:hypothetical protein